MPVCLYTKFFLFVIRIESTRNSFSFDLIPFLVSGSIKLLSLAYIVFSILFAINSKTLAIYSKCKRYKKIKLFNHKKENRKKIRIDRVVKT